MTAGEDSMGMLEDILKALDRIPAWKRLQEAPAEIDDLKRRITELEAKLGNKWPGDVCPFCGARAFRLDRVDMHGQREIWKCGDCNKAREIRHDLMKGSKAGGPSTWGRR